MSVFADRCSAVQALMPSFGVEVVLAGASADLRYLSGYDAHASERLTCFAVPLSGPPFMVIPNFEAPRLGSDPWFRVLTWGENDDPVGLIAREMRCAPAKRAAVADRTWAGFLVRMQTQGLAASWISATPLLRELRMVKADDEVAALRLAASVVDEIFYGLLGWQWEGRREDEMAERIATEMRSRGCEAVDFVIVGAGPNGASPHHGSGARVNRKGDAVILDFGGPFAGGYFADITRTIQIGEPSDEIRNVYGIVRQAQESGVRAVRAGVPCESVDRAARQVVESAGLGEWFNHRTGHGIGLDGHEEPYIVSGNRLALAPGMAFSIEPGVYLPGRFGVRIEDIVVCTATGSERLNRASRELHVVN